MRVSVWTILLITGFSQARAEERSVSYALNSLRLKSYFLQNNKTSLRHFFQFQNEQGNHYFVYEEVLSLAPLAEMNMIRAALGGANQCSVQLKCNAKAFCSNGCKNLYYELSNAPQVAGSPEKTNCTLQSFGCLYDPSPNAPPAAVPGSTTVNSPEPKPTAVSVTPAPSSPEAAPVKP